MAQLLETTVSGNLYASNIYPNATGSYDLGSSSRMWVNVYAAGLYNPLAAGITLSTAGSINISTTAGSINIYGNTVIKGNTISLVDGNGYYIKLTRGSNWWSVMTDGVNNLIFDSTISTVFGSTVDIPNEQLIYGGDTIHKMYEHNLYLSQGNQSVRVNCRLITSDSNPIVINTIWNTLWNEGYTSNSSAALAAGNAGNGYKVFGVYAYSAGNKSIAFYATSGRASNSTTIYVGSTAMTTVMDHVRPLF